MEEPPTAAVCQGRATWVATGSWILIRPQSHSLACKTHGVEARPPQSLRRRAQWWVQSKRDFLTSVNSSVLRCAQQDASSVLWIPVTLQGADYCWQTWYCALQCDYSQVVRWCGAAVVRYKRCLV